MISEQDKKQIAKWENKVWAPIEIKIGGSPDKRKEELDSFCAQLSHLLSCIFLSQKSDDVGAGYFEIDGRLRYHAVPENRELEQFLSTLSFIQNPPQLSQRIHALVESITVPTSLVLFITPQCPHCPVLVRQILPLIFATSFLKLHVIDGLMFPEMAKMYSVKSVPSLFLDDEFQFNGMVSVEELLNTIINRDPAQLSRTTLKNLLKEGKADVLADMMVRYGKIIPSFYPLLTHEKWPVRLGAMVAFEEMVHRNKDIAKTVVAELLEQFESMNDQVKGDMIYLFGLLEDYEMVPFFKKIQQGRYNREIKEAAAEALESMQE